MRKPNLAALPLLALASPTLAENEPPVAAQAQFAAIASWVGRWQVAETDALTIVFEITARGKTVVERWETAAGLHSMTVYHLDGDTVLATHYCPQGNQPRLETIQSGAKSIAFRFRDITGFDEGESHAFSLQYDTLEDGGLKRSEAYRGPEGLQAPSSYTLTRVLAAG